MNTRIILAFALLIALPVLGAEESPKIPKGYVLQVLEPTGGKILRPTEWHYTENHGRTAYKWIVSKENPKEAPYETGVMIQTFVRVKDGTGKSPEEFCKAFLKSREDTARKVIRRFPDVENGFFMRAGIEVNETVVHDGIKQEHHVVYSVFWPKESDLAVVMSVGCPETAWDENKERFDIMGRIELIDMKRFMKDGELKPERPVAVPNKDEAITAVESLTTHPTGKDAKAHAATIMAFAEGSPDVTVALNVEYLPWISQENELVNGELLLGAIVGGNILPQLKKGVKQDHTKEGLVAMLKTYAVLRKHDAVVQIKQLDEWGAMDDAQIDRFIKVVTERAQPLVPTAK